MRALDSAVSNVVKTGIGRQARLLAAGVSAIAIGAGLTAPASAAPVEGVHQEDTGLIAVNLYELSSEDLPQLFGDDVLVSAPGAVATATANIFCADLDTCAAPGAIDQFASGTSSASNIISIAGTQEIHAAAMASGGSAQAHATVRNGMKQVGLSGGDSNGKIEITGLAEIAATAVASGTAGAATADAHLKGIFQLAHGHDHASADFTNAGTLLVDANASAHAAGFAGATAYLTYGVSQNATAASSGAAAHFANDGFIDIEANAYAEGGKLTTSLARVRSGINQSVNAGGQDAVADLTNGGTIQIDAIATAEGTGIAQALAVTQRGLSQTASGSRDASALIDNSGSLAIGAVANAHGIGGLTTTQFWGSTFIVAGAASATAVVTNAIFQNAAAIEHASAALHNSGDISITAAAHASGPGYGATVGSGSSSYYTEAGPRAFAELGGAVSQLAFSAKGNAEVHLDNQGSLSIVGQAVSTSTGAGLAFARAWDIANFVQFANASTGLASVAIDNEGEISIVAIGEANAEGRGGSAFASGAVWGGIGQDAYAAGTAVADLTNSGSLQIIGTANAHASDGFAQAAAVVTGALIQHPNGVTMIQGSSESAATFFGDAHAGLSNSGDILIASRGNATGTSAQAGVDIGTGVGQIVNAAGSGDATLHNEGSIELASIGVAKATAADAYAGAGILVGIGQRVIAASTAAATVENAGDLSLGAAAHAIATTVDGAMAGTAYAAARLGAVTFMGEQAAFDQQAIGTQALVGITNSGSLTLSAMGQATGSSAIAGGAVISGIRERASASNGDATIAFNNSGSLTIAAGAEALATGGDAAAVATIANAIVQTAFAYNGDGSVALTNAGTIDLMAIGHASGSGDALVVSRANGVGQNAAAYADRGSETPVSASVSFDNEGTFEVAALAQATGGSVVVGSTSFMLTPAATAVASAYGLNQYASHDAVENAGSFSVGVGAIAKGPIEAVASAGAKGIVQQAFGNSGDLSVTNDGEISVGAFASASASTFASATAHASGIYQTAHIPDAVLDYSNSGSLDVLAQADAHARDIGIAAATVVGGVVQSATGGSGELSFDNSGDIMIGAFAEATGDITAAATAAVMGGVLETIVGGEGTISFANSGNLEIAAVASAHGMDGYENDIAYANALAAGNLAKIGPAIPTWTGTTTWGGTTFTFAPEGPTGDASAAIDMTNSGVLHVDGHAFASADGNAVAFATALYGMAAQATGAASADAAVKLTNDGEIRVGAAATGIGGHAATAVAQAIGGFVAAANATGSGDAIATAENSGSILVVADASADASTNALAAALGVTAVWQVAHAAGGDASVGMVNSGTIDVVANAAATGLVAQATAQGGAGGIFGGAILQSAAASNGDASGFFSNSGEIDVLANASAHGSVIAYANAYGGPGVIQRVWGAGSALAEVENSGSISNVAHGLATATNSAIGHAENLFGVLVGATGSDAATALVDNSGSILVGASIEANGPNWATANAVVGRGVVAAARANDGDALSQLTNSGSITIAAVANVEGDFAAATAAVSEAVVNQVASVGGNADAQFDNSGEISILANASAQTAGVGNIDIATAHAVLINAIVEYGSGIAQTSRAFEAGDVSLGFDNDGTIDVGVHAAATADSTGNATAVLSGGIVQLAQAGMFAPEGETADLLASATIANPGDITLVASAEASGSNATAVASLNAGLSQTATAFVGDADLSITNEGSIALGANAQSEKGELFSRANAVVYGGFFQSALASNGDAAAAFDNAGDYELGAHADASGEAIVVAFAQAYGGGQEAISIDGGTAVAEFENSGGYLVHATALGSVAPTDAATGFTFANAGAQATGLFQFSNGGSAKFANSGTFDIRANAVSEGPKSDGFAVAMGVNQALGGDDSAAAFSNSGDMNVKAAFEGKGENGFGFAIAAGYRATGPALSVDAENSGDLKVAAIAKDGEGVSAGAVGINLQAAVSSSAASTAAALLDGSLENTGEIAVLALASGGMVTTGTGTSATEVPGSNAAATGISLISGVNTMSVTNSGSINVDAVTGNGGEATAYGIRVAGNGSGAPAGADDLFTFTNDGGTIVVRQSDDGGESWTRGTAIDVADAPNATVINLLGDGYVYGDIRLQDGDEVNVADGTTYFDGVLNRAFLPEVGITQTDIDSGLFGIGTVNIGSGGDLVLADARVMGHSEMYDGPTYLFIDALDLNGSAPTPPAVSAAATASAGVGTITFQLQPSTGGVQQVGTYSQIFADSADISGGTLNLDVEPANGLFADNYVWKNLIVANSVTGKFAACNLGGGHANSLLLKLTCTYTGSTGVNAALARSAFDTVAGLNANGAEVGSTLEAIYDPALTGGLADVLGDLFRFADPAKYNVALNQLSGSAYANYLNSYPSLGVHQNDVVDHATDCEVPAVAASVLECRGSSPLHAWGQLDYQSRKADGDSEGGTSQSKRISGLVGVDAAVGNSVIIGGAAGYLSNSVRDNQFGDTAKGEGWTVGAYAAYDPGAFYVKGVTTYSALNGGSTRHINFNGLAPGATFAASPTGNPDVKMWTFGLHGGARLPVSTSSVVTPYLDFDYVDATLDGFSEDNGKGAGLALGSSSSNHTFLTGGVKWATQLGALVPEVNLGYRYRFGDARSQVRASFVGFENDDFDIVSAAQKRGTLRAGLSVGGKLGPVDVRVGYDGEFNGDVTSHSGNFKLLLPLGGHTAR